MSLLNSKFDIVSVDSTLATAALARVLAVASPPALGVSGTPTPGTIPPGAIVVMDGSGNAILGTTPDISGGNTVFPKLVFVTIDGNMDFSGAFVQKLTVFAGGFTMKTDQYEAGAYQPGLPVSYDSGKICLATDSTKQQVIGYVSENGLDAVNGVLEVIMPQGCGL